MPHLALRTALVFAACVVCAECAPRDSHHRELRMISPTYSFTIMPSEAPPHAREAILYKVVVRDRFSDEVVGKGPDLVFIPGLASSRVTWKATAERLPRTF